VCLEQTSANVIIEVESEMVIQVLDSLLGMWCLRTVVNTLAEQVREPLQRVLIHRIDDGEVDNSEEQD
jgi:hypothetical protein